MSSDPDGAGPPRRQRLSELLAAWSLAALAPADAEQALTHRSFAVQHGIAQDNERLEFLGDAVLDAIASEHVYRQHPGEAEGPLSRRAFRLVSRAALGRRAVELGLADVVWVGEPERLAGLAAQPGMLGSALEALIGTVFLGLGWEAARRFTLDWVIRPLEEAGEAESERDSKSELQEWAQQRQLGLPLYRRVAVSGPEHDQCFQVEVAVAGRVWGQGEGRRVKQAEHAAARAALDALAEAPEALETGTPTPGEE